MFVQIPRLRRAIVNRRHENAPAFAFGGDLSLHNSIVLFEMSCEQISRWATLWPRRGCWRRLSRCEFILTQWNNWGPILLIWARLGSVGEDEHKAKARHPFGEASSVGDVLNSPHRGTLACSIRCSTGSLTSWARVLVERLTLTTGSRSQLFWQG